MSKKTGQVQNCSCSVRAGSTKKETRKDGKNLNDAIIVGLSNQMVGKTGGETIE